jgi:hypothetical protein
MGGIFYLIGMTDRSKELNFWGAALAKAPMAASGGLQNPLFKSRPLL